MSQKVLSIFVLLFLVSSLAFAATPVPVKAPIQNFKQLGPRDIPMTDGSIYQYNPPNTDDIIGENFVYGSTWYDIQHNGTCGHQLNIDANGYSHLGWMNGLDNASSQRHIYYQLGDPDGNLQFTVPTIGVQVDQLPRGGYTTSVIGDDGRAFITYHQGGTANFHTAVSYDFLPGIGAFSTEELPWVYELGTDMEVIWPKCAIDNTGRIHIVSTENPASGVAGDPQRQYYGWAEYNAGTFSLDVCEAQELIEWTEVIAADVAASPVSDRVAMGYMQMCATQPETTQTDNDLILIISEDGRTWDWSDTINVTNFIPPDPSLLPDTTAANKDTLRAYTSMNLVFDNFDVLHVFFQVNGYYPYEGTWTPDQSLIYHWDEYYQHFSMVASGFFENAPYYSSGVWNHYACRASAAVDPVTNDIYCMYQRYRNPIGEGTRFPYWVGDTTDVSSTGYCNGDIWVSKSTDGGWSWSEGVNVTNTYTPGAGPNDCLSELTPSAAQQIYGDMFHFFYILDKDAGCFIQSEGVATLNDAIYHRVALSDIPESPRQFSYPLHIDSTGWPSDTIPPYYHAEPGKNLSPVDFALSQNYPNPFNPETSIRYSLAKDGLASLKVYNINGEEVSTLVNSVQNAGTHEVVFNAQDMASGLYFYTLDVNGVKNTKKMILLK